MTNLETFLTQCRERVDKATPLPWYAIPGDSYDAYPHVTFEKGHSFIMYDHAEEDAAKAQDDLKYPGIDANANFIAHARTDVPALLEIVEKLSDALSYAMDGLRCNHKINQGVAYDLANATRNQADAIAQAALEGRR